MAQFVLAAINSTPSGDTSESIARQLAMIERQCKVIDRLDPLGRMNYSRVHPSDDNHQDLLYIVRLCIQFEKYGKLEDIKNLLVTMKDELIAQRSEAESHFNSSAKLLDDADRGRYRAEVELEKLFSDRD